MKFMGFDYQCNEISAKEKFIVGKCRKRLSEI